MYRIDGVLGEGGMGIVYRATEIAINHPVVVKAIRPEFSDRADFRARILDEGRAVARIDHQNVVQMRSVFAHAANIFLVLQFVEGESLDRTLARYVEKRQFMPIDKALAIFDQILQGVGAAHGKSVIHRDIKPANIMIQAEDSRVKVTDFGIAKAQYDTRAATQMTMGIIGSPHYISPEQIKAVPDIDARTDIYSLGIVLFEMLAGRVPFDAPTQYDMMTLHMTVPIPSIRTIRPDVPVHVENVICRACAKDRAERFSSTSEMARALREVGGAGMERTVVGGPQNSGQSIPPGSAFPPSERGKFADETVAQSGGSTIGPLIGAGSCEKIATTFVQRNTHTRNIVVIAGMASVVLVAALIVIAIIKPRAPTCRTDETPCAEGCCNNATNECVAGVCTCKTGTPCGEGKVCNADHACVDGCLINGQFFSRGTTNPNNVCQMCADSNPVAWEPSPKGTQCKTGGSSCDGAGSCMFVPSIATGPGFTCGVTKAGSVKCWGDNDLGQLGDGTKKMRMIPTPVVGLPSDIASVSVGESHACALSTSGVVNCWGLDSYGKVGEFNKSNTKKTDQHYIAVAAGGEHTCFIDSAGAVKCQGHNGYGQLGNNSISKTASLTQVANLESGVTAISAGRAHTCALKSGAILCWGWNSYGQLGLGDTRDRQVPTHVSSLENGVTAISAGNDFTCAVKSTGELLCWGRNLYGQLGDNSKTSRRTPTPVSGLASNGISTVSAGHGYACALKTSGTALCWGTQFDDNGANYPAPVPTVIDAERGVSFAQISASGTHSCAITSSGETMCWGDNELGQLGTNSIGYRRNPTRVIGFP